MKPNAWFLDYPSMITMIFYALADLNWSPAEQVKLEEEAEEMDY